MSDNTGGRAFPWCGDLNDCPTINLGMTLRDYFAAKAMDAVISDWLNTGDFFQDPDIAEVIARDCYIVADAMLKARDQA
jgi:hypothetical protein